MAATLVHKAIGDRLHCVFVDNGLLRYKEAERVMAMFENQLHLPVTRPLGALGCPTGPLWEPLGGRWHGDGAIYI